jgi:subtilisin-like proprotein convertase family protein
MAGVLTLGAAALAQTTNTQTFMVNKVIPDGSASGLADAQDLDFSSQQLFSISDLSVTLNISGGFNGDYYAYLVHDNTLVTLVNRVGRTATDGAGYADSGLAITLSPDSANDIHNYETVSNPGGGTLTGIWKADGRTTDPSVVLDTDPQESSLDMYTGEDPSGEWTLFIADLASGQQGELVSWGLTVVATPEPGTTGMILMGAGLMVAFRRRIFTKR